MKKYYFFILVISLLIISAVYVYADEPVPPMTSTMSSENYRVSGEIKVSPVAMATAEDMRAELGKLRKEIQGNTARAKDINKSLGENRTAIVDLTKATGEIAKVAKRGADLSTAANINAGKALKEANGARVDLWNEARNLGEQAEKHAGWIFGLLGALIVMVGYLIYRNRRADDNDRSDVILSAAQGAMENARAIEDRVRDMAEALPVAVQTAVNGGTERVIQAMNGLGEEAGRRFDTLSRGIAEIPSKTAVAVKTLEPITLTFRNIPGCTVTYVPPIVDNAYLSLRLISETGERMRYGNAGDVHRSSTAAIKDYADKTKRAAMNADQLAILEAADRDESLKIIPT